MSKTLLMAMTVVAVATGSGARLVAAHASAASARDGAGAVITVNVSHPAGTGDVACALFASAAGFPDEPARARGLLRPVTGTTATCTFDDVAPGTYAVSVMLDTNRNGKADKNFLGIPSEPWGVSNNVRPKMRAPKFEEASFTVDAGATLMLAVELK